MMNFGLTRGLLIIRILLFGFFTLFTAFIFYFAITNTPLVCGNYNAGMYFGDDDDWVYRRVHGLPSVFSL